MPRQLYNALHAADIARLMATRGKHFDGRGLRMETERPGVAGWVFQFSFAGRQHTIRLGPVHDVSLAEARKKAVELRELVRQKIDPLADRDARLAERRRAAERQKTFKEVPELYMADKGAGLDPSLRQARE